MKKISLVCLLLMTVLCFSQNLNQYKYAMIPSKFSFLRSPNEFRLNTLSKMYMEKYGFEAYFDTDEIPNEIIDKNCNKIFVDVTSKSTLFLTKVTVLLKDCRNNILFTSKEGVSSEKEYAAAYNEAFREAFRSMEVLNHKYNESLSQEKPKEEVAQKTITQADQGVVKSNENWSNTSNNQTTKMFTVLELKNGIVILDKDQKVYLMLKSSSLPNIYHANKNELKGIFYKKNNQWIFEYYNQEDTLQTEILDVNF